MPTSWIFGVGSLSRPAYTFGYGEGPLSARELVRRAIAAERHAGQHVYICLPDDRCGSRYHHWFDVDNDDGRGKVRALAILEDVARRYDLTVCRHCLLPLEAEQTALAEELRVREVRFQICPSCAKMMDPCDCSCGCVGLATLEARRCLTCTREHSCECACGCTQTFRPGTGRLFRLCDYCALPEHCAVCGDCRPGCYCHTRAEDARALAAGEGRFE